MKRIQLALLGFLFLGGAIPQTVSSNTIIIENFSGENIELKIDANDRFLDVLDRIQSYFQGDMFVNDHQEHEASAVSLYNQQWSLVVSHAGLTVRTKREMRDYNAPVSKKQKEDIAYIVRTLAWKQVWEIWGQQDSLEEAGDRIDEVHPLNFLRVIFSSDELRAGISAIQDRIRKIKDKFLDGIIGSLEEEANHDNLLQFVDDFAKRLNIENKLISPSLKKGQYKQFVEILIKEMPREGADRYNM